VVVGPTTARWGRRQAAALNRDKGGRGRLARRAVLNEEMDGGRSELLLARGRRIQPPPHPQPPDPEGGEGEAPCSKMEWREEGLALG